MERFHGTGRSFMIDRNLNYFIDTNILVYAYDKSNIVKHNISRGIMNALWETENGYLSTQVLQEFYITVTQKVKNIIPIDDAVEIIRDLSNWGIHMPEPDDIIKAAKIQQRYKMSYWDSLIIQSSSSLNCDILFSEDMNSGQYYNNVLLINPFIKEDMDKINQNTLHEIKEQYNTKLQGGI
jgi:predicted nucleic acid-binding protein